MKGYFAKSNHNPSPTPVWELGEILSESTSAIPFSLSQVSILHIVRSVGPDLSTLQYRGRWHIHIRRWEAIPG